MSSAEHSDAGSRRSTRGESDTSRRARSSLPLRREGGGISPDVFPTGRSVRSSFGTFPGFAGSSGTASHAMRHRHRLPAFGATDHFSAMLRAYLEPLATAARKPDPFIFPHLVGVRLLPSPQGDFLNSLDQLFG